MRTQSKSIECSFNVVSIVLPQCRFNVVYSADRPLGLGVDLSSHSNIQGQLGLGVDLSSHSNIHGQLGLGVDLSSHSNIQGQLGLGVDLSSHSNI